MKYVSFIESKIRWRYRALVPRVSFSSGKVSRCAVIRDDHLRCYYLDNARCTAAWKYVRLQPGQWITLEGCISFLFYILPRRCRCFCCSYCSWYVDEKTIFDLPCTSKAHRWVKQYLDRNSQIADVHPCPRRPTRQPEPPRITRLLCFTEKQSRQYIVNFNFELILHYCDLRVSFYAFLLCYKLYNNNLSLNFIVNNVIRSMVAIA